MPPARKCAWGASMTPRGKSCLPVEHLILPKQHIYRGGGSGGSWVPSSARDEHRLATTMIGSDELLPETTLRPTIHCGSWGGREDRWHGYGALRRSVGRRIRHDVPHILVLSRKRPALLDEGNFERPCHRASVECSTTNDAGGIGLA